LLCLHKWGAHEHPSLTSPYYAKPVDTFTVEFSGLSGRAFADFARKERETLAPIIEKADIKLN